MNGPGAPNAPYHPSDHPEQIRSTDAQRDAVAEMVRAAASDGRIDLVELDQRLGQVYAARTHGELAAIVADIVPHRAQKPTPPYPAPPQPIYVYPAPVPAGVSERTILPGFLLCLVFGLFGAHRFYAGKTGSAIAMIALSLVTFGIVSGVWAIVDAIVLATGSFRDGDGRRMQNWT